MTKTLTGEQKTVTATIEAIERSTRSVTLKETNGDYNEIYVPTDVKRFDTLKVGDKITAKYYENIVLRLKLPGEKATDTDTAALTPGTGAKAGGTAATQRTITATITAHRSEGAVDRVQRAERLALQLACRGQGSAREGEGRRSGGHHLDDGGADFS